MVKEGEMSQKGKKYRDKRFPPYRVVPEMKHDGYAQIYVGFVSGPLGERNAEPCNNNEDDEGRDEEQGTEVLEVICKGKGKRRGLAGAEVTCP